MTYLYNLVRYLFLVIVSLIHIQANANEIALSINEELIDFRMTSHLQQNFAKKGMVSLMTMRRGL